MFEKRPCAEPTRGRRTWQGEGLEGHARDKKLSTWQAQASKKPPYNWQGQFLEGKTPLRNQRVAGGNRWRNQRVAGARGKAKVWKETPLMGTQHMAGAGFEETTLMGTYNVAGPIFLRKGPFRNQRVAGGNTWQAQISKKRPLWEFIGWQSRFLEGKAYLANQRVAGANVEEPTFDDVTTWQAQVSNKPPLRNSECGRAMSGRRDP